MKYLTDKIGQGTHGTTVNRMCILALEVLKEHSDILVDFGALEFSEMCKILGFKDEEKTYALIDDAISHDEFAVFLTQICRQNGFLAELHIPELSHIKLDEEGNITSCRVNPGICRIEWVYANTVGEMSDKILQISKEIEQNYIDKSKTE